MTVDSQTPAAPPQAAHLGWRLIAIVYDLMPLIGIWMFTALIVLAGLKWATGSIDLVVQDGVAHQNWIYWNVLRLALLAGTAAYFILSWRRGGQTIGMRAWRLHLTSHDGSAITSRQAWLRFAMGWISSFALGLGFVWSLVDRDRRTWHDRVAGTRLLRVPKGIR